MLTLPDRVAVEQDGLRDGEHLQAWMTDGFRQVLAEVDVPVIEVLGACEARVAAVQGAVAELPPLFSEV